MAYRSLRGLPYFLRNRSAFLEQYAASEEEFPLGRLYPCLGDRFAHGGEARSQYFTKISTRRS